MRLFSPHASKRWALGCSGAAESFSSVSPIPLERTLERRFPLNAGAFGHHLRPKPALALAQRERARAAAMQQRHVTLIFASIVTLSSGTNYV